MLTEDNRYRVLKLFLDFPEKPFHIREIARLTGLSPPGVSKIIRRLKEEGCLVSEKKNMIEEVRNSGEKFVDLKASHNLYALRKSGLIELLREKYEEPEAIVLFGSYARGEDNSGSDIDIAVMTRKEARLDLKKFEKALSRKISVHEVRLDKAEKPFINSLANGVVLYGYLKVA